MKKKKKVQPHNTTRSIICIISLVYIFMTLLAFISEVTHEQGDLMKMFWPNMIFICIMVFMILVSKNDIKLAVKTELILGVMMVIYVLCRIIYYDISFKNTLLNFIFPIIYILHPLLVFKTEKKGKIEEKLKEKFTMDDK